MDPIIDATVDAEGQEAIFCESTCNAWLHRQCSGLSQSLYKIYQDGDDPFYCPHCRLTIQEHQLQELKSTIESLSKEVSELKSGIPQSKEDNSPPGSTQLPQQTTQPASDISIESDTNRASKSTTTSKFNNVDSKAQDRKFNVVFYGIKECTSGTPRKERINHDLDNVTSIVTQGENSINPLSIRDLLRLGKYRDQSRKPRPILVKLNRTIDVSILLSKAKTLPKDIYIKPDMTREERLTQSVLLKERWSLIQSGIERKDIRIRSNKIFVKNQVHGQVINSSLYIANHNPLKLKWTPPIDYLEQ